MFIGDSTTAGYGGRDGYVTAADTPLAFLLARLPEASRWGGFVAGGALWLDTLRELP